MHSLPLKRCKDSLSQQANYVAELLLVMKATNWTKSDKDCYMVSANWFNKWNKHVNFAKYFKKKQTESAPEDEHAEHPGEIDNRLLLEDGRKFYHNYDFEEARCNFPIRDSAEITKDYYVVAQEVWDYLQPLYGGITLKRDCIYFGKSGIIRPDVMMAKVRFW